MSRNIRTEALVLKASRMQEFHKSVTLLTPGRGMIQAVAHGAYKGKGKLGASTDPFVAGTAYLYHDPVKDSYKVSELEARAFHEGIRASLEKLYTAAMWAEVILKSYGGGGEGGEALFALMNESLDLLDRAQGAAGADVQFLWRFVTLQGFMPNLEACAQCGRPIGERDAVYYVPVAEELCCPACAKRRPAEAGLGDGSGASAAPPSIELTPGALRYLRYTERLPIAEAAGVGLEERSLALLERFLRSLVQGIVEVPILTLKSGVL